jgi:hypothetical protein
MIIIINSPNYKPIDNKTASNKDEYKAKNDIKTEKK